ncbi:ABC transporter ATP-binding protein [Xylocopilactobacillus apis]|uniref:ABC transporter domain-containing protein n=1 Tax=Xylocopilactobacillus apis TaxID=2932183 RepID=A0AAU9D1C3_9LACO|nr:ATP-binding cassette domain-containing protein [Xylocopilactobacillus apis]BDR56276.1 hypothetical protein KIMC2_08380 [Xylocopilactobacillus apis]
MIKIEDLSFEYTTFIKNPGIKGTLKDLFKRDIKKINALEKINLKIRDGEMVGLIGPNGAGKTTLTKLLTGILHPTQGTILVNSTIPSNQNNQFLKEIGVLFGQKSQLSWDLPAIDTLNMLSKIYSIPTDRYQSRLQELTRMLDVEKILRIPVRKLSLGQRVRCELMCSLIHSPKYLFLDEPTLGLDIVTQSSIYKFLKKENREHHTTIIITSHYLKDIEELTDRLLIIMKGSLVYDGSTNDLPINPEEFQHFLIKYSDGEKQKEIVIDAKDVSKKIEELGIEKILSVTRQGISLEDFVMNLFAKKEQNK